MGEYEIPAVPNIEEAYRAAHRALEGVARPGRFVPEADLQTATEVISQFPCMLEFAEQALAAELGPRITWQAPPQAEGLELAMAGVDFTDPFNSDHALTLGDDAFEVPGGEWHGSALNRAAYAYKRDAGWDFTPGKAGFWLLMLAPVEAIGSGEDGPWNYTGHLAGFVIVHDRDEDGVYETVVHIWTASAWRHRGIAQRLLSEARRRFGISEVEGPYSADGAAFLAASENVRPPAHS